MVNIEVSVLKRCVAGDVQAFRKVVDHYQLFAYSVAFRMLGNKPEAEDVVQECFVKAWRKLGDFDLDKKFSTWFFKIITNACIDKIRRQPKVEGLHPQSQITQQSQLDDRDLVKKVQQLTLKLPDKQRAVFVLVDLEGFENHEAADILNVTADNIKSNLYQARKAIRTQLIKLINFNSLDHGKM